MAEREKGLARKLAASLADEIGRDRFDLYFSTDSICVEHGQIVVQAEDAFSLDRIRSQFQGTIRSLAQFMLGDGVQVVFGLVGEARVQKDLFGAVSHDVDPSEIESSPSKLAPKVELRKQSSNHLDVETKSSRRTSVQSESVQTAIAKIKQARQSKAIQSEDVSDCRSNLPNGPAEQSAGQNSSQFSNSKSIQATAISPETASRIGKLDINQLGGGSSEESESVQLGLFGSLTEKGTQQANSGGQESVGEVGGSSLAKSKMPKSNGLSLPSGQVNRPKPGSAGGAGSSSGYSSGSSKPGSGLPGAKQSMSLQGFHFGNNNHLAKAATQQVIAMPGEISPLVIFGPVGCGKTHLATGLGHFMKQRFRSFSVLQLSAEQFTSRFLEALNGSGLPSLRSKLRQVDLLVLEDIQFFAGKKATLIELQHTLDSLIKSGKQLILTADRHPNDLTFLSTEVQTRLVSGLLIPLNPADREARTDICNRWCAQRNLDVLPEMIDWIAENISGDVRRLSGALFRVMAMQMSRGDQVRPSEAMDLLSDYVSASSTACSLSQIQKVVSGVCGVGADEINGSRRTRKISGARMLAMFLARKHTGAALSEIGDFFGGRRHSTVLAAEKRVKGWVEDNSMIETASTSVNAKEVIRKIESQLRAV